MRASQTSRKTGNDRRDHHGGNKQAGPGQHPLRQGTCLDTTGKTVRPQPRSGQDPAF
jgi:hypothetical protein